MTGMSGVRRNIFRILGAANLLLFVGCPSPMSVPEQTVRLAADYIGATEVWLRVSPSQGRGVRLVRDGVSLYSKSSLTGETLVIDSLLRPKTSYSYTAIPLKD
jgi:hypothetical protein